LVHVGSAICRRTNGIRQLRTGDIFDLGAPRLHRVLVMIYRLSGRAMWSGKAIGGIERSSAFGSRQIDKIQALSNELFGRTRSPRLFRSSVLGFFICRPLMSPWRHKSGKEFPRRCHSIGLNCLAFHSGCRIRDARKVHPYVRLIDINSRTGESAYSGVI
ncbi:MAG: hypothetical protein DI604_36330, partial [Delftia acidovorans]